MGAEWVQNVCAVLTLVLNKGLNQLLCGTIMGSIVVYTLKSKDLPFFKF